MKLSSLLISGVFVSATLTGCGGGSDEPSFGNREPIALGANQSQVTTDKNAAEAGRYNAEREKALKEAGVRPADSKEKPDVPLRPGDLVAKKPGDPKDTKPVSETKQVVTEPEFAGEKKQCAKEEATTGVISDFCKSITVMFDAPKPPVSINDLEELNKQCAGDVANLPRDVAANCERNADLLQMFRPG